MSNENEYYTSQRLDARNENAYRLLMPQEKLVCEGTATPVDAAQRSAATGLKRISSRELLGVRGELVILHMGREYRLRITQNGRLILTA